jgi:hypothetical protein
VSVSSTAQAHGLPNSAKTKFSRSITNVAIQGNQVCSTSCDPGALATQINAQFAGVLHVDFPSPDAAPAAGSPGGYEALLRRPLGEQVQDEELNDQPAHRTEVPGMVITLVLGDNQKPAREILYLAGTEVEARYGIYPLGQSQWLAPPPDLPSLFPSTGGYATSASSGGLLADLGTQPGPNPAGGGAGSGQGQSPLAGLLPPGGWRWVAEHPIQAMKLLFMWTILLSPIYVAARRWLLIQRNRVLLEAVG